MIGNQTSGGDGCYRPYAFALDCFPLGYVAKGTTDDQPDPGNKLFQVDPPHIASIGRTGPSWPGGMAVVNPAHAPRQFQINANQFAGIKFTIYRSSDGVNHP